MNIEASNHWADSLSLCTQDIEDVKYFGIKSSCNEQSN